ncbi:MAG TPA: metalloregulator ArsR/SmtB family transcription factor [Candidatus Goldiibacteriota bacterium]|nr:metalloregulator ArsR/SmtB family transcription factor [Candidatus Goldiibacteriota bacterium]HPN63905.1 metalloregulator ArsR/SmtB family transcription factor [Candidatus Goldiibacteriota bacterium]HRQ44479.1 metalloregulator ArsR/SmtB family transcription factor [Candidatus Goldiibacteriota bacterium]
MKKNRLKDTCDVCSIDKKKVTKLKKIMPSDSVIKGIIVIFSALGNKTRAKIVFALSLEERLCVCDISNILGLTISAASHQLRKLRDLKIVTRKNEGNMVYYSLNNSYIRGLLANALRK